MHTIQYDTYAYRILLINFRTIIFINGVIACSFGILMLIPLLVELFTNSGNCSYIFITSIISCLILGGIIISACKSKNFTLTRSDAFILVVLAWITSSFVSSFPFYIYHGYKLDFISAFFESVSGITTTGATIYKNVEILPLSLNIWRFILHFIGGIGVIAISLLVMPIMRIGGMQLFQIENSDKSQKFLSKSYQVIAYFILVYCAIILLTAIALSANGMNLVDSICYSISAVSTGGFSNKNYDIITIHNSTIELILSVAMLFGSITIIEVVKAFKCNVFTFFKNQQIRTFLMFVLLLVFLPILFQLITDISSLSYKKITSHTFQVISAITTTGFDTSHNYINPKILLILFAIIGGCSGSTTGGIKIFRLQILYAILKHHISKLSSQNSITFPKYNGTKIDDSLTISVISYIILLVFVFVLSLIVLALFSDRSISSCCYSICSCLFNLGYDINFYTFSIAPKCILIFDMIIGRLEIIPIFVALSQVFNSCANILKK